VESHVLSLPEAVQPLERARIRELPRPEDNPGIGRVILDDSDRIWIERYPAPNQEQSRWDVFSLDSSPKAVTTVDFPAHFEPRQVLDAETTGIRLTDFGVENVVVLKLPF